MSADLIPVTDTQRIVEVLRNLIRNIEDGEIDGLALVAIHSDGGFEPVWFDAGALGPHGGSILRGAVCWLGADMDAKAHT